ncbi:MAG: alpha/beta hydrolase [Proteobacteria bacterium]|jgi:pimeloyl-ACP methyl ester carboxylesterase|nr:alpha/beta hydrolase [Pseudomonadota bacterium]
MALQVDTTAVSPPSTLLALSEGWRALLEASTLLPSLPFLRSMPRGDGHPVYLLPGFMADSQSTGMLRRWLDRQGYNAIPWGFGRNLGPRGLLMERLIVAVGDVAREHGRPVSLLGQSLGGIFAREIAKVIPQQIRQVITLGSPFRQTETNGTTPAVMRLFEMATGEDAEKLKRTMGDISRPAPVPSTAIYSRTDGIANWKTCIEEETPQTDNIEVYASHCGMGFNPAIYYVIGDRLAQPAEKWRKFERSGVRCFIYPDAIYAARRARPASA